MSTITVDSSWLVILRQAKGVTELRDADGNLIGTFTPKGKTDEEIKKLFNLDKAREKLGKESTRPFREMIENLEKLAVQRE